MMNQRTIALLGAGALAGALAVASFGSAFAQTQPGFGLGGMMGGRGVGPGVTSPSGYGPGMMGRSGYGPGMMGWGTTGVQAQPLKSLDDAKQAFHATLTGPVTPAWRWMR